MKDEQPITQPDPQPKEHVVTSPTATGNLAHQELPAWAKRPHAAITAPEQGPAETAEQGGVAMTHADIYQRGFGIWGKNWRPPSPTEKD
jgi:hypothetical protein